MTCSAATNTDYYKMLLLLLLLLLLLMLLLFLIKLSLFIRVEHADVRSAWMVNIVAVKNLLNKIRNMIVRSNRP